MSKNILISVSIIAVIIIVAVVVSSSTNKNTNDNLGSNGTVPGGEDKVTVGSNTNAGGSDICSVFPKEDVASITGLDIVSSEVFSVEGSENSNCRYYVRGKSYAAVLSIGKYEKDPSLERQKYADGVRFNGWRTGTNSQIPMEHFITYNEVQQLNDIYLINGANEYYRIALYSLSMVTSKQMVELALQVAQKINI